MGQAHPKRRAVLIVEDDAELRGLSVALLEEGDLETIECESAEAALATMLLRGRDIALIFADIRLPGVMDGLDLAREVKMRWPLLTVVLTSGHPRERFGDLPPGVGSTRIASPSHTNDMPSVTTIDGRFRKWMSAPSAM